MRGFVRECLLGVRLVIPRIRSWKVLEDYTGSTHEMLHGKHHFRDHAAVAETSDCSSYSSHEDVMKFAEEVRKGADKIDRQVRDGSDSAEAIATDRDLERIRVLPSKVTITVCSDAKNSSAGWRPRRSEG